VISLAKGPISPPPDCTSEAEKAISLSVIEKHKQNYDILHSITLMMFTLNLTSFKHTFTSIFLSQLHLTQSKI